MAFTPVLPSKQGSQKPLIGPARKPTTPKKSGTFVPTLVSKKASPSPAKPANYGQTVTKTLKSGGQYQSVVGEPNKIVKTERSQDALKTTPYGERDHTVPVSLGGTSSKENLKIQEYSGLGKIKKAINKFANAEIFKKPEQPSYKTEMSALKDYEAGKISLPEARLRVISYKDEQELKKKGITQSTTKNFLGEITKGAREIVGSVGKVFAEGVTSLARVGQTLSTGKDTLNKPAQITVENPALKKILTFGDTTKDPTKPLTITIKPLFTGQEKFGEMSRKIIGAGTEIASNIVAPGSLTSVKTLKIIGKTPLSALSKDVILKFSKQLAIEKALPGFTIGAGMGAGSAIKEGLPAVEVIKEGLLTGAVVGMFELGIAPFRLRSAYKKEMETVIKNGADPNISYIERPDLGKDVNGKPILTRSEIDPRTGKATVEFRQDLKKSPTVFLRSLDVEHGKIVEAKMGKIKNEGTVLSRVLDDFSEKTGQPKADISKKITFEVKKLGGTIEEAVERIKKQPALKREAPTLTALVEHRVDPNIIKTRTSTEDLTNDLVEKIKKNVPKVEKTELDSPLHQEARKYKSAEEFAQSITDSSMGAIGRKYEGVPTTNRPITDFNLGEQKIGKVNRTQRKTSPASVDGWIEKIKNGERPPVVVREGLSPSQEWIQDGHNRLAAYQQLGFKEVPTINKSQLTKIHQEATTKKPRTADDYNKKLPEKLKMKHPKEAEQLESHAKKSSPKEMESRVYERMKEELPENMRDELTYSRMNLKEDAEKAVKMIANDRDKALRIAIGLEEPPKGQTATAINIALVEKARLEENWALVSDLIKSRSLDQTRRGQEIVAEKGSVTDNSMDRYVKELISARLTKLGKAYLGDAKEYIGKMTKGKAGLSPNQRAMQRIKIEAKKAAKDIGARKVFDLAEAQRFIDSLAC